MDYTKIKLSDIKEIIPSAHLIAKKVESISTALNSIALYWDDSERADFLLNELNDYIDEYIVSKVSKKIDFIEEENNREVLLNNKDYFIDYLNEMDSPLHHQHKKELLTFDILENGDSEKE